VEKRAANAGAHQRHRQGMTSWDALKVGFRAVHGMIPGTSRAARPASAACCWACSRKAAPRFQLFIAIPTWWPLGATALWKGSALLSMAEVAAFAVVLRQLVMCLAVVRWLLRYIHATHFSRSAWVPVAFASVGGHGLLRHGHLAEWKWSPRPFDHETERSQRG